MAATGVKTNFCSPGVCSTNRQCFVTSNNLMHFLNITKKDTITPRLAAPPPPPGKDETLFTSKYFLFRPTDFSAYKNEVRPERFNVIMTVAGPNIKRSRQSRPRPLSLTSYCYFSIRSHTLLTALR
jgi:hypothetical protein